MLTKTRCIREAISTSANPTKYTRSNQNTCINQMPCVSLARCCMRRFAARTMLSQIAACLRKSRLRDRQPPHQQPAPPPLAAFARRFCRSPPMLRRCAHVAPSYARFRLPPAPPCRHGGAEISFSPRQRGNKSLLPSGGRPRRAVTTPPPHHDTPPRRVAAPHDNILISPPPRFDAAD